MAKQINTNKKKRILERRTRRNLFLISLFALSIKILVIFRIQGLDWYEAGGRDLEKGLGKLLDTNVVPPNAWYGADAENYLRGLQGLIKDGVLSSNDKLSYWPAGYPLLMLPIIEIFRGHFFLALSLIQSCLYTFGSIWFIDEIRKTRLSKIAYPLALVLAFNPTLSLNTIAVGYELPVVALTLVALAALIRFFVKNVKNIFALEVLVASVAFSFAVFMQPRLLVIALVFFMLWAFARYRVLFAAAFLALTMGIVSIAPSILVIRNYQANGFAAISTNLGTTMRLGAGPGASGGYSITAEGVVECPQVKGNASEIDRAGVECVVRWYLENPGRALILFWNKARFFWSPWFGPEANGTMARNPWSQNHPFRSTAQTEDGFKFIYGGFGKLTSWLWMLGGFALLIYGFICLWRLGDLERLLGLIALSSFLMNLTSSMLTIGDHRFRIPSMAASLLLQVFGIAAIVFSKSIMKSHVSSTFVHWPSLRGERSKEGTS